MKPLYEYLNESVKWTPKDVEIMRDMLAALLGINISQYVERYCPTIKNFVNFMDDHEKSLLNGLYDRFSNTDSSKINLSKDEKKLVQRIAVFVYKHTYILNKDILNLYSNAIKL